MAIKLKDVKLLWGRSANRCAICKQELSHDPAHATSAIPLGEQAHIVAEEPNGPRGKSILTIEERNAYSNLVLLCPTDHTLIDKVEADFPIEKLHQLKSEHELWVREKLSTEQPEDQLDRLIYSHLIDQVVRIADFPNWNAWVSRAVEPTPRFPKSIIDNAFELSKTIDGAVWPGTLPDLEASLIVFSRCLLVTVNIFSEHISEKEEPDNLIGDKFYRIREWNVDLYNKLLDKYNCWTATLDNLLRESTRAANWIAANVRRHLNPMFFALEGKFQITEGAPYAINTVYEYTDGEIKALPEAIADRLNSIIRQYSGSDENE
jgi:hypothetical protein